ncbi:MAG: glutamate--tRNA ligase [Candidatus Dojkabacteria bacterium]
MRIFRIAPSPTGYVHLGTAKSWIINHALAQSTNGKLILRIEDTDLKRNKLEVVDTLIEDIKWLGIEYDLGPEKGKKDEYFQTERFPLYQKFVDQLIAENKAYKAYETPEERELQIKEQRGKGQTPIYSGAHANLTEEEQAAFEAEGRTPIIRMRVPKGEDITFKDAVFGEIKVSTTSIGDIAIQKSDGSPLYNFAVAIDDHDMEVTDVVRGFGHLANTPKQILVYRLFDWDIPSFAHFSDVLNPDGKGKLSKRHGAKSVFQYRSEGYLPDAIFNYIIVISCSFTFSTKDEEIMTREHIYEVVSPDKILKTNSRFDPQKLDWMNGQHIRLLEKKEFIEHILNWLTTDARNLPQFFDEFDASLIGTFIQHEALLRQALPLVHTRINRFMDIFEQLSFFFIPPQREDIDISPARHEKDEFDKAALILYNLTISLTEGYDHTEWEHAIRTEAENLGWKHGDLFMALRILIVGSRFSPPLYESMQLLGIEECSKRIKKYLSL